MHSQTTFFTNSGYIDLFKCSKISMKVIYMESDTPLLLSDYITHFKAIFRTGKSLMGKLPFVCVFTPVLNNSSGIHYFRSWKMFFIQKLGNLGVCFL